MNNLTNAQKAVIATPAAMEIIVTEAKKFIASKFNTTVEMVEIGFAAGNENVQKMLAELIAKGINEAATIAK